MLFRKIKRPPEEEEIDQEKFFQNAQAWVGEDKNNPFDYSNQLSGQAPENVRKSTKKTKENVRKRVRKNVRGQEYQWKAARNAEKRTPGVWITWLIPFALAAVVGVMFADGQKPIFCIIAALVVVMTFLLCNPFYMVGRVLAKESRGLIVADMVLVIIEILVKPNKKAVIAAVIWTALTMAAVKIMNKQWLSTYNWLNSEHVRSALVKAPENRGLIAWKESGKRECRTALAETGLEYDDDVLQMYAFPCYMVGVLSALRKNDNSDEKVAKAEADLQELQEKYEKDTADMKEKIARLKDLDEGNKDEIKWLEENLENTKADYESRLSRYTPYYDLASRQKKEIEELKQQIEVLESVREENQRLMIANEQLLAEATKCGAFEAPEDIPEIPEADDIESKVIQLLSIKKEDGSGKNKYSYAKISQMLDGAVGKTKVGEIAKKMKALEEREAS